VKDTLARTLTPLRPKSGSNPHGSWKGFPLTLLLLTGPILYLTKPWEMDLPLISRVAAVLVFPVLGSVALYAPVACFVQYPRLGSAGKQAVRRVAGCLVVITGYLFVTVYTSWTESLEPALGIGIVISTMLILQITRVFYPTHR
jgi:hypothetical protein